MIGRFHPGEGADRQIKDGKDLSGVVLLFNSSVITWRTQFNPAFFLLKPVL